MNAVRTAVALTLFFFAGPVLGSDEAPALAATWVSLAPPLLAIALALILRQVIPALFAGVWLGAWVINGFTLSGMWSGLLDSFAVHLLQAAADEDHMSVILFSLMIGGTVGIISRNGGLQGIVNRIVGDQQR